MGIVRQYQIRFTQMRHEFYGSLIGTKNSARESYTYRRVFAVNVYVESVKGCKSVTFGTIFGY